LTQMTAELDSRRLVWPMVAVSLSAGFLVGGYEFIRSSAASIFMDAYGAQKMPYAMTAAPFALALMIYLYGKALSALGPLKTLLSNMLISALIFTGAYLALKAGASRYTAGALYVFAEAYIVILVEQYWSFINSTLSSGQAKIFNGPIAGGGAIGPMLAGWFIGHYAKAIGTEHMLLISAGALVPAGALIYWAYKMVGEPKPSETEAREHKPLHLSVLKEYPVLPLLMVIIFLTQVLSTMLNLNFYQFIQTAYPEKDARTAYLGTFWMMVNGGGCAIQFLLAPILLKRVPFRGIMTAIPAIHLAFAAALLATPLLPVAAMGFGIFKMIDYSIFRAVKELIYIPLSYDARYRAKQVVDSFTYRFSKGSTAGVLSGWELLFGKVASSAYAWAALAAALVWLVIAQPLSKAHREAA